jgi:3-phenylpropionate/cinnamic acid dioxygenase small subunit
MTQDDDDANWLIRTVLTRYARAVDRCEWDTVLTCFEPDALLDFGQVRGSPADFVQFARAGLESMTITQHILHQTHVDFDGDDAARSETYVSAFHRMPQDGGSVDLVAGARYLDRFVRSDDGWRIAERVMVYDWTRLDPVLAVLDDPTLVEGRRDRTDRSWRWFGSAGR